MQKNYDEWKNIIPVEQFRDELEETDRILDEYRLREKGKDLTDAPLSPVGLSEDTEVEVFLSEKVTREYQKLVEKISNPDTAAEYPFVLLGKAITMDGKKYFKIEELIYCYDEDEKLDTRIVNFNQKLLNEAEVRRIQNGYNLFSIGHTHPIINAEERKSTIAEYMSEDFKKNHQIREPGLNISLADMENYNSIYTYFARRGVTSLQTIIMFNGEIVMFGRDNDNLFRQTSIYNEIDYLPIPVMQDVSKIENKI